MNDRETFNSDLRLMELAARNPSLGGRELLQEIIERGPVPEETERLQAQDSHAALASRELDHPDYRTPVEQANWLNEHGRTMRDLYEHGAGIKGEVLVIPAEEYELSDEREKPFITTLSYAMQKIDDIERAREFHELALAISGETADARTQIAVFKTYYDRIRRDEREDRFHKADETDKTETLTRTLEEMRMIASEMAMLETRESVDAVQSAEDREEEVPQGRLNTAARRINLREESLRLPAGLRYEQKERLVSLTIPEIDRRLERGVSREALFKAIDRAMFRPDPAEYLRKLAELADKPADEIPERPISKEEHIESQQTLLQLCERERLRLRELKAARVGNELEPYEDARLSQVENLVRRLRQGLGRNVSDDRPDRTTHSRLFISLPERGVGENALRLPVSQVKVYETMAKIAASEKLSLQTWAGKEGPEVRLALTEREADERSRIGAFLKNYVGERLRDPETRVLNTSSVFRDARAVIFSATTPEALGRVAADLLRVNERRSEELRQHPREIAPGEPKINQASFQPIPERHEPFAQSVLDSLNPGDRRRLAELDRYAAQTREDVYRAFELLDAQRRDLELVRARNQFRAQEADVSHPIFQTQSERLTTVGTERSLAMPCDKLTPIVAAAFQEEKLEIGYGESVRVVSSIRVQSDQAWRFDSLREVLRVELNGTPGETPEREVWQSHQADHGIVQER